LCASPIARDALLARVRRCAFQRTAAFFSHAAHLRAALPIPRSCTKEIYPLDTSRIVLVSCSVGLLVLALALVREVRLRRALQRLLARLLAHIRGKKP
jgi:hypothetical protein